MKLLLMFLVALGTLAVAPAYAAPCKGEVISADGKLTVGKCWTNDTDAQELIAMACGEGDKCEVYGTITRAREIKRVGFATGPKGISFKMKPCPKCIEGMQKASMISMSSSVDAMKIKTAAILVLTLAATPAAAATSA